ncbi:MAG TPA: O-antigen ligase family protein [Ilumatobacteraceae bacterium]|nr:O-antigen ligase family protein [Ilumatobacteraceae bacterium]
MTLVETEPDLPAETVAGDQIGRGHSQFARWGLTSHDVLVLAAGALFCAGTGPFEFGGWTLRMAALLGGLPLGVVLLVRLAWNRDRAALAAVAFVVWAFVAALASGAPWRSIVGQVDGNTESVVIFLGVFGFWALARRMSDRGRALVGPVLVGALAVSALVGVLQIVLDIRTGSLAQVSGRAGGLEGNAVLFSATLCGAAAWCSSVTISATSLRSRRVSLACLVFFALAIGLSGSRVSVASIVLVSFVVCWRARNVSSLRVPAAALLGLIASWLVQLWAHAGANTADRLSSAGDAGRWGLWRAGFSAIVERPILGWGPGRIRPAIQHHFTSEFVRLHQNDDRQYAWTDIHNIVIEMLIAVGIVGVVLLTVFVVLAFRRVDFGMGLAAVAISINWLLQPAGISSLGVAAIFLGASSAFVAAPRRPIPRWPRVLTASAVALGLTTALALVAADLNLRRAVDSGDPATIRSAAAWFGNDPLVLDVFVLESYSPSVASDLPGRVATARRTAEAEPDIPLWWSELAMTQFESNDLEGMRTSIETALALQPNHTRSWVQLTIYAESVGDTQLETHARARACELGALFCQPG